VALKAVGHYAGELTGSAEQTISIRKVHEALMYFNLAVCLEKPKPLGAAQSERM
jgi:hypothetical protein